MGRISTPTVSARQAPRSFPEVGRGVSLPSHIVGVIDIHSLLPLQSAADGSFFRSSNLTQQDELLTVVMESEYIRETFEKMFEYIWNHS